MALNSSGEMYLESIFVLSKSSTRVRSVDVAEHMGFSKPSISRAMGLLKKDGLIVLDDFGCITLTEKGKEVAQKIYERHTILTRVLTSLGVDEKTASEDACRIEHVISDNSFAALKAHLDKKTN